MKLDGRVAVITGGGGAIGGAQARLFGREGAAVCVADLFADKAESVASEISCRRSLTSCRASELRLPCRGT